MWFFLYAACTGLNPAKPDDSAATTSSAYHPAGYSDPAVHGNEAKQQTQACTECHGADLTGVAEAVSCDSCHPVEWRTDCTFCHGGGENTTGAPPVDIDGSTDGISFPEHTAHVTETIHTAFDCVQCHTRPADVLSAGHLFVADTTAGVAEMNFLDGLSPAGTYTSAMGCDNLYCHGNGQEGATGSVQSGDASSCAMCHADANSGRALSGQHGEHVGRYECEECHSATVTGNTTISSPANHVNGVRDLVLPDGIVYDNGTCEGACHGESHRGRRWN